MRQVGKPQRLVDRDAGLCEATDTGDQPEVVEENPDAEGTPADGEGETPPVEETAVADEQEQEDEDPEQIESLLVPTGSSSITINKHVCYGPVSGDIYEMAASCDGADQVYTFNLYFGVGAPIAVSQTNGSLAGFSRFTARSRNPRYSSNR